MKNSKLAGKVAIITGAGHGIGKALSLALARENAKVIGIDINESALQDTQHTLAKDGYDFHACLGDVTADGFLASTMKTLVEKYKRIHIWVNNAGMQRNEAFMTQDPELFRRIIHLNFLAVVEGSRVALSHMHDAGGGTIINMASVAGHIAAPYMSAYAATKHAVVGFTRSLGAELALDHSPVKTLLVSPGFVDTQILAKGEKLGFPSWLDWILSSPDDVAAEIIKGLKRGKEEVFPTLNGRLMLGSYRLFPKLTAGRAKILLATSWKEAILGRERI